MDFLIPLAIVAIIVFIYLRNAQKKDGKPVQERVADLRKKVAEFFVR